MDNHKELYDEDTNKASFRNFSEEELQEITVSWLRSGAGWQEVSGMTMS